jgi:hypothetical protein
MKRKVPVGAQSVAAPAIRLGVKPPPGGVAGQAPGRADLSQTAVSFKVRRFQGESRKPQYSRTLFLPGVRMAALLEKDRVNARLFARAAAALRLVRFLNWSITGQSPNGKG